MTRRQLFINIMAILTAILLLMSVRYSEYERGYRCGQLSALRGVILLWRDPSATPQAPFSDHDFREWLEDLDTQIADEKDCQ